MGKKQSITSHNICNADSQDPKSCAHYAPAVIAISLSEDPLKLEPPDRHALLAEDWVVYRNEATGTGASGIVPVLAWLYAIIPLFLRIFLRSRDILKPSLPDDIAPEIDHRSLVGLV